MPKSNWQRHDNLFSQVDLSHFCSVSNYHYLTQDSGHMILLVKLFLDYQEFYGEEVALFML